MLVVMGALADGTKELVAIHDGERESTLSWSELLRDLKRRGLKEAPAVAVGDGALGFWAALEEVFPATRHQRCWVHKTANVLDKMPKKVQPSAKALIHEMYMAETRKDALDAFDEFVERYEAKYPKAVACLVKDKDVLFTFYDFPAEHWTHLRTTNPIESTFATVRHRHRQTKGCGSRTATLAMVFKLAREAEKTLAKTQRPSAHREGHRRRPLQRRHRKTRRIISHATDGGSRFHAAVSLVGSAREHQRLFHVGQVHVAHLVAVRDLIDARILLAEPARSKGIPTLLQQRPPPVGHIGLDPAHCQWTPP